MVRPGVWSVADAPLRSDVRSVRMLSPSPRMVCPAGGSLSVRHASGWPAGFRTSWCSFAVGVGDFEFGFHRLVKAEFGIAHFNAYGVPAVFDMQPPVRGEAPVPLRRLVAGVINNAAELLFRCPEFLFN